MPRARRTLADTEPVKFPKPKPKRIGSEGHHCSQCNRPTSHETWEHPDGVTMKCPCGYSFVDVRDTNGSNKP